ncbi:hypothetical protein [Leptolyngbya sp. FACHB-261]|uniref:hypothetical protein n=1 Tax=Leptolyngbya sp. FACHB-261 TaxID=2692806 RepID=UPI001684075C|nr:hypothetical protein [Leptolyngbya sp. FACHB-261]MBD2102449.1 hypothetical protein [Leptolyngbya sp. FACHB-261]
MQVFGQVLWGVLRQALIRRPTCWATVAFLILATGCVGGEPTATSPTPATNVQAPTAPQSDFFRQAVDTAVSAANLVQTAQSKTDWDLVVTQWQEAIALMKAVPKTHERWQLAQTKIGEYQRNLVYAQKRLAIAQKSPG